MADVNGDKEYDVRDAMLIAQFIVGDIDQFPVADSQNNGGNDDHESIVMDKPANNNDQMQSIGQTTGNGADLFGAGNNVYGDVDNDLTDKNTQNEEPAPNEAPSNAPADTGDDFPMGWIIVVMVLCAAGVAVLVIISKRKGEK